MSDEDILALGGTQEDIDAYAHDVGGACGAVYDGTCDQCGKGGSSKDGELRERVRQHFVSAWQDGFGCATRTDYKNRDDFHTDKVMELIKQYGIQQRIEELDKLPRTGWISNGIRYDAILFTQIDNRKLELIELKDKQEDK